MKSRFFGSGLHWKALTVAVMLVFAQSALALTVTITGTPGTAESYWTFSGSTTVAGGSITIDNDNGTVSWGWDIGSAFYLGNNTNLDFTSTNVTMTVDGTVYDVFGVGAEANNPDYVFGLAIEDDTKSQESYIFDVGDELIFSGTAIAPVGIDEFAYGETNASDWLNDLGDSVDGTLPVTFIVDPDIAPVPATGGLGLGLMFLLMIGLAWRRLM